MDEETKATGQHHHKQLNETMANMEAQASKTKPNDKTSK